MEYICKNRITRDNDVNAQSSRSHLVLKVKCIGIKTAIINFVDLAGSERMSKSKDSKTIDNETIAINKSLLCLKNCIIDQFKKV